MIRLIFVLFLTFGGVYESLYSPEGVSYAFFQLIPLIIGGAISALSARSAGRSQAQASRHAQDLSQAVRDYINGTLTKASPAWDKAMEALDFFGQSGGLSPEIRDTINQTREWAGNLPQAPGQVIPPNPQDINAPNPSRLGAPARAAQDQAFRTIQSGGMTGDIGFLQDRAQQIFGDAYNSPGIGALEDRANELLAGGGRTDENRFLFDSARDIIQNQGYTPELNADRALGRGLVTSGGVTPQIAQMQAQLQSISNSLITSKRNGSLKWEQGPTLAPRLYKRYKSG